MKTTKTSKISTKRDITIKIDTGDIDMCSRAELRRALSTHFGCIAHTEIKNGTMLIVSLTNRREWGDKDAELMNGLLRTRMIQAWTISVF